MQNIKIFVFSYYLFYNIIYNVARINIFLYLYTAVLRYTYFIVKVFYAVLTRKCGSFQNKGATTTLTTCLDLCGRRSSCVCFPMSIQVWGIVSSIFVRALPQPSCR